mmetsp:Transcript_130245/g.405120  ORF Transcript_130245/g.405120 Transcript_130245/m.405120 type:complete len:87 (+) Transcript_130245:627-887(+)
MLKQIRERSGATITLLREQVQGQRPCILAGTLRDVLRAEKHVFDLVRAVMVADPAKHERELPWLPLSPLGREPPPLEPDPGEVSPT